MLLDGFTKADASGFTFTSWRKSAAAAAAGEVDLPTTDAWQP